MAEGNMTAAERTPYPTRQVIGAQNPTRPDWDQGPDITMNCLFHTHCAIFSLSVDILW